MSKRVLIFGASGFVGRYLVKEFFQNGYEVFGCDRIVSNENQVSSSKFLKADLCICSEVNAAICEVNPDIVINLAAVSSVGQSWKIPQSTFSVNVIGVLNILEACKNNCPEAMILLVGSSEEYAPSQSRLNETSLIDAKNPYGISKMTQEVIAEMYANTYGMNILLTRSFNHTGPGQNASFVLPSWCKQVYDAKYHNASHILRVGNLDVSRDFCDVRDVVKAYRMISESTFKNTVFNVGSGKAYLLKDLLSEVCKQVDINIQIEVDHSLLRPADNKVIWSDITKIEEAIGWRPIIPIEQTICDLFNSFKGESIV